MYVGAFGAAGARVPLSASAIKGNTLHHSAIFNADRNEYFIAWDVDINFDGKPDKIYAMRLSPNGVVVGRQILDSSANIRGKRSFYIILYLSRVFALFFCF